MEEQHKDSQELVNGVLRQVSMQLRGDLMGILSAITRVADELDEHSDNEGILRQMAILRQGYYRILRLTNNLSDVTSMDAFAVSYPRTDDLVSICREMMERTQCAALGMGIRLSFSSTHPCMMSFIDRDLIERMLLNLLSNALRATPKGGEIRLELSQEGNRFLLRLTDTGCGIPEEKMDTLFARYLETDRCELDSGFGVGLAVCRKIATLHGGTLLITSTPGVGTVVTVSLAQSSSTLSTLSTYRVDYSGGHDRTLMELADVLPLHAFEE